GVQQRWRDHWKQCWAQLADEAPAVLCGDVLRLSFEHDDLNMRTKMLPPQRPPSPGLTASAAAVADGAADAPPAAAAAEAATAAAVEGGLRATPRNAKEVLAALQAEAEGQQLMPLLSWLGPQALLQLGDANRLTTFGSALQAALSEAGPAPVSGSSSSSSGG
ncbi:hypothetical protein Agub_g3990, partial [Astrephomene gubernaculifera]